ncbi:MAG: branched-chain amino acid transaminase [Sandaracinaceae bacterium]|nr:branched chain amino acid aminotransferase [Myxococcales bacterium]
MVDKVESIWMDGKLIPWDDANVHVLTHTLHYGLGAFEGIRCYETEDGRSAIFRLREHVRRLFESAHIVTLDIPYSQEELVDACIETVRANGLKSCYLRPLVYVGSGAMGLGAMNNETRVAIVVWKWGAYLGDEGLQKGIRARVSSFTRPGINMQMAKGKIVGHYVNSILAKREALKTGFDEAILLDAQGYVSEASGENIFMVRDGKIVTPPMGSSILGGITRDTMLRIIRDMGIEVTERLMARDELYIADEIFMCGTAAEVTPVREIDGRQIGKGERGAISKRVQDRYFQVVRGVETPEEWLTFV